MRNGLSAVLIVKNEEKVLDRCLSSIAEVDELVILDTGSTDGTVEIAKEHTSKVYVASEIEVTELVPGQTDRKFHFAKARNLAMTHAKQDWILTIDADEVVHEGGIPLLRKAFLRFPGANIFDVRFIVSSEGGKDPASLPKPKVFRRGRFEWQSRIHERLIPKHPPAKGQYLEDVIFEHLPQEGADKEARRAQNLELLQASVQEEPAYLRNSRQLGMEYFAREQYREAIPWLELYLKSGVGGPLDRSETLVHLARCHAGIGVLSDALPYFDQAIEAYPSRREPFYFRAVSLIREAYLDQAVESLEACLAIPKSSKPDWYLNIENIWDDTYPNEALEFCRAQIAEAKAKLAARKKSEGKV